MLLICKIHAYFIGWYELGVVLSGLVWMFIMACFLLIYPTTMNTSYILDVLARSICYTNITKTLVGNFNCGIFSFTFQFTVFLIFFFYFPKTLVMTDQKSKKKKLRKKSHVTKYLNRGRRKYSKF